MVNNNNLVDDEVPDPLNREATVEVGPLRVQQEVRRVVVKVIASLKHKQNTAS